MKQSLVAGIVVALLMLGPLSSSPSGIPPYGPWSAPINLGAIVNSSGGEFFPAISKDGLSLYFTAQSCPAAAACRPGFGGWDIYVTRRAELEQPWGAPENLGPVVNTAFDEVSPELSTDGHRLFFASNRPEGFGGNDIYMARRHDKRDDFGWQPAENLGAGVNSPENDAGPALFGVEDSGASMLYFDSNRPEGPGPYTEDVVHNGNDIYASVLDPDEAFGPAQLVAELSTAFVDRSPTIRRDGLEVLFTSNRPGRIGVVDLWAATRERIDDPWSTPVNLGAVINGPSQQAGAALSFDGTTMYFQASAQSHPGFGNYDLFVSARTTLKHADREK